MRGDGGVGDGVVVVLKHNGLLLYRGRFLNPGVIFFVWKKKRKTWKIYLYSLSFLFNDMVQKELAILREHYDWWRGEIRNQGINSTGVGFTKAPFVIFPVGEFFILYNHHLFF